MENGERYENHGGWRWAVPVQILNGKPTKLGDQQWTVEFRQPHPITTKMGKRNDGVLSKVLNDLFGSLERGESRGEESSGEESRGEWFSSTLFGCF